MSKSDAGSNVVLRAVSVALPPRREDECIDC
uniref:Uncharacterized protein n=1 Tax=Rhodopseudomonas palustris (strain DX-1) TaxID=652103 RepID=E6VHE0_RHOPX